MSSAAEPMLMEPRFETKRNVTAARAVDGKCPVHVVCAANAAYIMPLCAMLASLIDNFDAKRELVIHIISNEATAEDRENVRRTLEMNRPGLERIETHWYSVDISLLRDVRFPPNSRFSLDTYTRILIPQILPEECEWALYLDSDMIVLADVSKLYDAAALDDRVVHAVHDIGTPRVSSKLGVFDYAERGIGSETHYFNAGLLVIDLRRWREQDLTAKLLEYAAQHGTKIQCYDQGALNALLHDDWAPVDPRWNQGYDVLFPEFWDAAGYSRREWRKTKNHPFIVHYSGHKKPWQPKRRGPRYSYFFRYLQKTVFKDSIPDHPRLESVIGIRAYYLLWKLARKIAPGLAKD
jgi:lipopolysaccharide biosynthesis glycosyltransferase